MGIKERREREREELRARILDAARELFAAEGYEAVTMRKIADRIEYSPTAIYLHFRDKLAVIQALCDLDFLTLARRFSTIARIADPFARLRAAGRAYADFGLEHPNHYRLMFMTPHPPPGEDALRRKGNPEEDAYAFLKSIVADAAAQGRLRDDVGDVEAVAQLVWAGVHGVVSLHLAKCNDPWVEWKPPARTVELMVDALVRGIERDAATGGATTAGRKVARPANARRGRA